MQMCNVNYVTVTSNILILAAYFHACVFVCVCSYIPGHAWSFK